LAYYTFNKICLINFLNHRYLNQTQGNYKMDKDFDKTLPDQLREIYAHYYQQQKEAEDLSDLIKEKPNSVKLLSETPPWSHLYELPYRTFLAIGILEFELTDIIHKIARSDNQIQAFLELMEDIDAPLDIDEELTDEEKAFRFSFVIATTNQISSIAIHSLPLSNLIEKIREGNDDALFDAVLVDQSIVAAPSIAHRIQIAQLTGDGDFMDLLSKAIKGSRPKRDNRDNSLDDLRYMLEVVDEEIGIDNITREKLHDILAKDLELYDHDSLGGFKKVIQRRNKRHRT